MSRYIFFFIICFYPAIILYFFSLKIWIFGKKIDLYKKVIISTQQKWKIQQLHNAFLHSMFFVG